MRMETIEFLKTFALIFGVSTLVVYLFHKLKIPAVVGFLFSGMIIGPYGLGFAGDTKIIELFAEIGLILLLFIIGIELSPTKLIEMRGFLFLAGALQILITTVVVVVISVSFWGLKTSIFIGLLVSLSSTAIVLKYLIDRGEVDAPYGRVIVGILIFQDLVAVLATAFIPLLSGEEFKISAFIFKIFTSFIVVVAVIWASRKFVPILMFQVIKSRIRELLIISVMFLCFSIALLASEMGFSLAFGAFLAGLLISESEYAHQVTADIIPFRESFMALFFVSIGMLLNFDFVVENLTAIVLITLLIIFVKVISTFLSVFISGGGFRISAISAIALAQVSEFSFVLILLGKKFGFVDEKFYNFFISVSVITMIIAPFLLKFAHKIPPVFEVHRKIKNKIFAEADEKVELENHVIIVGFGLNGKNVARVLKSVGIPYVVLELNILTVRKMREEGEPIFHGDASSVDVLRKVGIKKAKLLIVAISDPASVRRIVSIARSENPDIYIIVRTRYVSEVDELKKLGADEVIPEEFETSIEISSRVLNYFKVPTNLLRQLIYKLREDIYKIFRGLTLPDELRLGGFDFFKHVDFESYVINKNSKAVGKSLAELNLKSQTGAWIVAVQRGEEIFANPSSDFVLNEGDMIVMLGKRDEIEKAIEFLDEI